MNNEINIAEILKDYPKRTKLYSPLFGDVTLEEADSSYINTIKIRYNLDRYTNFHKTGLYYNYEGAECLLFPSSEMRDWKRFFKRGDVVIKNGGGMAAVFDDWANDTYTEFNTTVNLYCDNNTGEEEVCDTLLFRKATDEERKQFIEKVEGALKGKYNPETLQVEPVKPEVPFNLKPFDKVLVRDDPNQKWTVDMFSSYNREDNDYPYICVGNHYCHCLPYNEQTAHLVGTKEFYNP
jgi:hypothetical protein